MTSESYCDERGLLDDSPTVGSSPLSSTPASPVNSNQDSRPRSRLGYTRIASTASVDSIAAVIQANDTSGEALDLVSPLDSALGSNKPSASLDGRFPRHHRATETISISKRPSEESDARRRHRVRSFDSTASTALDLRLDELDTSYDSYKDNAAKGHTPSVKVSSIRARFEDATTLLKKEADNDGLIRTQKRGYIFWATIVMSVFCAISSIAFIVIAAAAPNYGHRVSHMPGSISPSLAATLTTFLAKLIESSFSTVVVAVIGQVMARKVYRTLRITITDVHIRSWILQPATIFTNWTTLEKSEFTLLTAFSLLAALFTTLYTSAATTLVQPQLRFSDWKSKDLQGFVQTRYANPEYISENCNTPIHASMDPYGQETCVQIEHSAAAYHNYFTYIGRWKALEENGGSAVDLALRPQGFALLNDNTTISAPWIDQQAVQTYNVTHPRYINNITMALPHVGVIQAAIDPINNLLQPEQVDGAAYNIIARVPSPFINVLCATVMEEDLQPYVYELWPDAAHANESAWRETLPPLLNGTTLDQIFGFGPEYSFMRLPPTFSKLPIEYNTIMNTTNGLPWGRPTIFILGKGGGTNAPGNSVEEYYSLCQLQSGLTPSCSTHYNASAAGGSLAALCDDPSDEWAYNAHDASIAHGNETINRDWPNIASTSMISLALNDGVFDGNSSNARLLTQFMVTTPILSSVLPSMAEALAVLNACTLIQAVTNAPFAMDWFYPYPDLNPGVYQTFEAFVRTLQYSSGGKTPAEKAFFVVLVGVAALNIVAFFYVVTHHWWYTDICDPLVIWDRVMKDEKDGKKGKDDGKKNDHDTAHDAGSDEDEKHELADHDAAGITSRPDRFRKRFERRLDDTRGLSSDGPTPLQRFHAIVNQVNRSDVVGTIHRTLTRAKGTLLARRNRGRVPVAASDVV